MSLWNQKSTIKLIKLYRERENLWNSKNIYYKNKSEKKKAFREMSDILGKSVDDVRRKIVVILSGYRRTRLKVSRLVDSGYNENEIIKSVWYGYKYLTFLKNRPNEILHQLQKRRQDEVDEEPSHNQIINAEDNNDELDIKMENIAYETGSHSDHDCQTTKEAKSVLNQPVTSQITNIRTLPSIENRQTDDHNCLLTNVLGILSSIQKTNEEKDDFTVFGEYISRELRKIKNEHALTVTKHCISNLIFEAQLGNYDKPHQTK